MCQELGANSDSETARYHYLNDPFIARFVRFHPTHWKRRIGMRAGLIGCPQTGPFLSRYIQRRVINNIVLQPRIALFI